MKTVIQGRMDSAADFAAFRAWSERLNNKYHLFVDARLSGPHFRCEGVSLYLAREAHDRIVAKYPEQLEFVPDPPRCRWN